MKIAMVSDYASPLATGGPGFGGGQHVHVAGLARALGRMGHHVTVYTRRRDPDVRDRARPAPRVTVEQVAAGPERPLPDDDLLCETPAFAAQLARRWAADRPDVIHAHYWTSGLAALVAARDLDLPVVETFHRIAHAARWRGEAGRVERVRLERAIGRTAAAVIATSESEHAALIRVGVLRHRLAVVPGGVDVDQFTPCGPVLPRGGMTHRLLALGSPAWHTGIDTAIGALARIPGAELIVAGGPPLEDLDGDPAVHRLLVLAQETGVDERVTFLGRVAHGDVPRLLRSVDLTVSLPWDESSELVALESMACGVPVVTTAVGGHLDSVIDGITGIHVLARRPAEAARRIRALLDDPTLRESLGIAGVDRARSRYSWDRVARETLGVYEAVRRRTLNGPVAS